MKQGNKGFLAAGLGVSCCILPLFLIVAGLGGSFLTVFLVQYKAYLMTLAAGILIYSWIQYSRDAKQCATQMCELVGGKFRQWMLGINTGVVIFFFLITYTPLGAAFAIDAGSPNPVAAAANGQAESAVLQEGMGKLKKLALRVEGMT